MKIFDHPVWKKTVSWVKNIRDVRFKSFRIKDIKNIKLKDTTVKAINKIKDIKIKDLKISNIKIKNIKIAYTNIKQMTALLLLAFFLTTGFFSNTMPATAEVTAANAITAYKVVLNGKEAGYVCDPVTARIIMQEVLQDASENYGMQVSASHELVFEEEFVTIDQLSTKAELEDTLTRYSDIKVNGYTIYADNTEIGILRSEEEAKQLLDRIKSKYVDDESKLEDAYFQENVTIVSTPVDFYMLQNPDEVAEEIEKGFDTVEEYEVQSGDTLWSISRAFGLKIADLQEMNPELKENPHKLKLGQKIQLSYPKSLLNVVTTEVIEYEKSIPFETETKKDSSLYTYQSKVEQKGQEGLKKIEARVIKVNGKETEREIISEKVIKEPVNKIIAKGTKKASSSRGGSSGSSGGSGGGKLAWPVSGTITSRYGYRWGRLHKGLDIAAKKGTPIYAAESGKVTYSGWKSSYGNIVIISHGGGMETYYAHMSKRAVSAGTYVNRGQLIGYVGSTGNSTGPHLHFEVRINDSPRNPLNYLR